MDVFNLVGLLLRYVLNSKCMKKFFDYIQLPNFDVAVDAIATFKVVFSALSLSLNCHKLLPWVVFWECLYHIKNVLLRFNVIGSSMDANK